MVVTFSQSILGPWRRPTHFLVAGDFLTWLVERMVLASLGVCHRSRRTVTSRQLFRKEGQGLTTLDILA